ncbi:MAG: flagellar hook-associated protein FlgL [Thermodesulfobacteriota bacterium]|nr:flagellar hook-associated protein FlgL [Thermodesulfobacteriota bacterium]
MKSTQSTTYRSLNAELNTISGRLENLRNQAATGKKLIRPSDDPAAIRPVLSARTQIRATDRFVSSLATAGDRLANQDSYLDQAENLLVSAKETTINAINGAMSDADLNTLADEIGYIKTEMLSVANAQVGGQYIFAGFQEDAPPFVVDGDTVSYQGDSNIKKLEASPGEYVQTNLTGAELFMGESDTDGDGILEQTGQNVFDVLTNLERAIRGEAGQVYNGNTALPSSDIGYLDAANGDYTPIAMDGGSPASPVLDGSSNEIPLTFAGEPISLQPVLDTDGNTLTIDEYNTQFPPGIVNDYTGTPLNATALAQPMYVHADGTTPAELDATGQPVISYDSGTAAFSLLSGGSPLQMTEVPTLDDMLSTLETTADQSRSARGRMGNNAQRIETSREHLEGVRVDLEQILSRYEDVDIIDVLTEITQTETAFEAALNVTGKVGRLSILDYI